MPRAIWDNPGLAASWNIPQLCLSCFGMTLTSQHCAIYGLWCCPSLALGTCRELDEAIHHPWHYTTNGTANKNTVAPAHGGLASATSFLIYSFDNHELTAVSVVAPRAVPSHLRL